MQINLPKENTEVKAKTTILTIETDIKKLDLQEDSVLVITVDFDQLSRPHLERTIEGLKKTIKTLKDQKQFEAALILPKGIDLNSYRPEQLKQVIEQIDKFRETCYQNLLKKV
jgi:hypothetical protein